jgi:uncharacterized integral membrane protein
MFGLLRTIALVLIAVIATLFFVQNLAATEVAFLTWSVSAPRAVIFALIFVLGLAMGALLVSLRSRRKQTRGPAAAPAPPADAT